MSNVLKILISIFGFLLCLQACHNTPESFSTIPGPIPQRLSPYVLWQTYRGSGSVAGLLHSTILHIARVAQNIFSTAQVGKTMIWSDADAQVRGEIRIIDVLSNSSVPCVQYDQTIVMPQETRKAQGIACMNTSNVWQIVEENPVDPPKRMF